MSNFEDVDKYVSVKPAVLGKALCFNNMDSAIITRSDIPLSAYDFSATASTMVYIFHFSLLFRMQLEPIVSKRHDVCLGWRCAF